MASLFEFKTFDIDFELSMVAFDRDFDALDFDLDFLVLRSVSSTPDSS